MKLNIVRTDYLGKPTKEGQWCRFWTKCDGCGAVNRNRRVFYEYPPNTKEVDLCRLCKEARISKRDHTVRFDNNGLMII